MLVDHPFWPRGLISDASAGGLLFDLRPDKAPILADVSSIFISNITMYWYVPVLLALTPRSRLLSEFPLSWGFLKVKGPYPLWSTEMQLKCLFHRWFVPRCVRTHVLFRAKCAPPPTTTAAGFLLCRELFETQGTRSYVSLGAWHRLPNLLFGNGFTFFWS